MSEFFNQIDGDFLSVYIRLFILILTLEYALIPISYDHQMFNIKIFLCASSTRTPSLYKLVELTGIYS
jgi:hypothetical protein